MILLDTSSHDSSIKMNDFNITELQTITSIVGYGLVLFITLLLVIILVLNRRNMDGWDLPISYVWFAMSGRINRKTYWLTGFVGIFLIMLLYQLFSTGNLMAARSVLPINEMYFLIVEMIIAIPFLVFLIWAEIAVTLKRLHDRDRSAWFLLIGLIPIIGIIWLMIELGCLRGTHGDNRFGPTQPNVSIPASGQRRDNQRFVATANTNIEETLPESPRESPNRDLITARLGQDFFDYEDFGHKDQG